MDTTHDPDSAARAGREAALAAGRAHEDGGRLVDAVAEYDRAQRLAPDPALAHRILRLRHEAMLTGSFGPGAPTWPLDLPDPFPGATAPPEIGPDELTASVLGGSILHHGCLIVRGLLDDAEAGELRQQVVRSIEARDRTVAGSPVAGDDQWYQPFDPSMEGTAFVRKWQQDAGGMLMADSPMVMWRVLDIVGRTGVRDAISGYLQEPAAVSFKKCVLRQVREASPSWHQDGSFMGSTVRTVDLWIALSDCGTGTSAPGLDIVPTRVDELLDTQTHGAVFPYSIGEGLVDLVTADRSWTSPQFAPGDAILFDDRFVHRSGVGDEFTSERYAIEAWFFGASTFPDRYGPILA